LVFFKVVAIDCLGREWMTPVLHIMVTPFPGPVCPACVSASVPRTIVSCQGHRIDFCHGY
jgi:hypothetical protein